MDEPQPEKWESLTVLARRLPGPTAEKHLHPYALQRWRFEGLRCKDGSRVKLHCRKIGGRWCSTAERLEAFFEAVNGPAPEQAAVGPTKRQADARQRRVMEELRRRGYGRPKHRVARQLGNEAPSPAVQ